MIKVQWTFDLPEATVSTFNLVEGKTWKGDQIRGADVAEMIAEEIWETEAITVSKIHIVNPARFAGTYEVKSQFEPTFSAQKVTNSEQSV